MGNIRYQLTAHRITSAVNCRPLKPSSRSICPAAPYPTGVHIPGIPPPAKFATEPYEERGALCEDTIAPKGECRVYTLALRPSHALSAFAAIGRGPKSGKVAQARACHGFPVDSVALRHLS